MALKERMGLTPPEGPAPIPISNFYVDGLASLQKEYRKSGLERFRPHSEGILAMYEEDEKTNRQEKDINGKRQDSNADGAELDAKVLSNDDASVSSHVPEED
jgi:hypothetical protein